MTVPSLEWLYMAVTGLSLFVYALKKQQAKD